MAKFSDNAVPSLVVAIVIGLVMFNLNQTNDRITRLEDNQQEIAVALATLTAQFAAFEEEVGARFAAIDTRFGAIDARLTKLDENQLEIAQTLARLVALAEAG